MGQLCSAAKATPKLLAVTNYTTSPQALSWKDSLRGLTQGNSKQMSKFLSISFKQTLTGNQLNINSVLLEENHRLLCASLAMSTSSLLLGGSSCL